MLPKFITFPDIEQESNLFSYIENMTYILAGKMNGKTFIQSDCLATKNKTDYFVNKLLKFQTDNTFFTCSGSAYLNYSIQLLDNYKLYNNDKIDIYDDNLISEVMEIYFQLKNENITLIKENFGRIYLINNNDVIYFDIEIDLSNNTSTYKKTIIQDGEYITSIIDKDVDEINLNFTTCDIFIDDWFYRYTIGKDLKNRYTRLKFENGETILKTPYLTKEDLTFEFYSNAKNYKELRT